VQGREGKGRGRGRGGERRGKRLKPPMIYRNRPSYFSAAYHSGFTV